MANSIEYKSALVLELWAEIRELDDEKVLQAKHVILQDLLAQDQDEIKKSVCENVENLEHERPTVESLTENCPECPVCNCSSDGEESSIDRSTMKEKAFEYLVTNFKKVNYEKVEKHNFKEEQFDQDYVLKYDLLLIMDFLNISVIHRFWVRITLFELPISFNFRT